MKKILHLVDDHQVVERSLSIYEKIFPGQNEIIVFANSNQYKHIDINNDAVLATSDSYKKVAEEFNFNNVGCVVVHYMSYIKVEFIKLLPSSLKICWAIYGGDLYINYADILKHPLYYTNPDKYQKYAFLKVWFPGIYNTLLYIKTHDRSYLTFYRRRCLNYILQRIDYLIGADCDIELLENYSTKNYISYNGSVYPLKETLKELYYEGYSTGNDIMVGNSASFTNNHLYALFFLKQLQIPTDSVIRLTLSYGGNEKYKYDVIKNYKKYFLNNLGIIKEYMPLSEYNRLFLNTKIYISSAWRQESFGTILMCFFFGIKVYLSKYNPLYFSLIKDGFKIFLLEEIEESFHKDLSIEDKNHNKLLLTKLYDSEIEEVKRFKFFSSILG